MSKVEELRKHISDINTYLLTSIFFMIPIKVGPAYIISVLILLLWLIEGGVREKWENMRSNPLVWVFWCYFIVPFISLLWSEDILWGINMAKRGIFFLLFPLYLSVSRKGHIKLYITTFIASVGLAEILSYYNWLQIHHFQFLPEGIRSRNDDWQIAPFVSHIMYNPILAFAAYLLGHAVMFEEITAGKKKLYLFFLATISVNMLISGGRSGQAGFFAMIVLLIFQRFARRPVIAAVLAVGISAGVFVGAYLSSDLFSHRVDLAVHEITNYEQAVNSSAGLRINFALNTARMILESPLLGVGVGDYPAEYARNNALYTPEWVATVNPHNQYLFDLSTAGFLGGGALLLVFFFPLYHFRNISDRWSRVRIALIGLYLVICFGESYLWRSNTALMFVVFSAVLYSVGLNDNSVLRRAVVSVSIKSS